MVPWYGTGWAASFKAEKFEFVIPPFEKKYNLGIKLIYLEIIQILWFFFKIRLIQKGEAKKQRGVTFKKISYINPI